MRSIQLPGERPCTLRPSTTCSPSQVRHCYLRLNVICFTQYRINQSITLILFHMCRVRAARNLASWDMVSNVVTTTDVVIPPFATARDLNARLPITKPIKLFVTKSLSASWGYVSLSIFSLFSFNVIIVLISLYVYMWIIRLFSFFCILGVYRIDMHRLRPPIVSMPPGTERSAN